MKKVFLIAIIGIGLGVVDIIPLFLVNAPVFNMIAIAVFWIVAAVVMAKTSFVKNTLLDGVLMATVLMLPLILTVSAVNPKDFLPMLAMAVILGPICSVLLKKFGLRES